MTQMPVAMLGRAWRTPLGTAIDEVVTRWLAGDHAIVDNGPRTRGYAVSRAAPIGSEPARSRDARFVRRMGLFGLEVARDALAAAGVVGGPRVGAFAAVGGLRAHWDDMLRGLAGQALDANSGWERGLRDVHPYWMLRHLSNNVHALAATELALRGEGATFGGGSAGAQAIASAARALYDGAIDYAVILAYDSLLEPETLVELGAADDRLVPGEAAASIVIGHPDRAPRAARLDARASVASHDAPPSSFAIAPSTAPSIEPAMGHLGAAHPVVAAIAIAEWLARAAARPAAASATMVSAPGLVATVTVELPS